MLSFAVLTMAGAFERQLPPPPSHFRLAFLLSVWVPEAAGVPVLLDTETGSATDVFEGAFWDSSPPFGVLSGRFKELALASVGGADSELPSSAGAWWLGFAFLRGLIPT